MNIEFYGSGAKFGMKVLLDAPRDLVWQAWSKREAMAKWWGPKGFGIAVTRFEFRPGGTFLYSMKLPNGDVWWGRFVYREIVEPERIVFANGFSDETGGLTRAVQRDLAARDAQHRHIHVTRRQDAAGVGRPSADDRGERAQGLRRHAQVHAGRLYRHHGAARRLSER